MMLRPFLTALGFLTRLAPARIATPEDMARSLAWLPAAGLALGVVLLLPFFLGLLIDQPLPQAWALLLLSAWLTRGLHFDGLADVFDAMSHHLEPDRFWTIVKDSRIGVFGGMALILFCAGQICLYRQLFEFNALGAMAWSFMAGRCCSILLGAAAKGLAREHGLAATFLAGADAHSITLATLATVGAGFLLTTPQIVIFACLMNLVPTIGLARLAQRVGGINGDFLGAATLLGELTTCLAAVMVLG